MTGAPVERLDELRAARIVMLDLGPRQVARLAGDALPAGYRRPLLRYRYGAAAFKLDWALDGPVPWAARRVRPRRDGAPGRHARGDRRLGEPRTSAATVHERPFVLFVQPTLFDPTPGRPPGKHIAWAYCHVPNGCDGGHDRANRAPGRAVCAGLPRAHPGPKRRCTPADFERRNANLVGGDINGGTMDLRQVFARPVARLDPYRTPLRGVYLCSASTPPGGGVHGMGGFHAAPAAVADLRR